MSRPTVAILTAATDAFWRQRYLLHLMIPRWEELGVRVAVVTGESDFVPADVALLHADLTVVPDACLRLAERYPRVLNGPTVDIRKRRISRLLVGRDGPDPGPVIVKTDLNCGGLREFRRDLMESPLAPALQRLDPRELAYRALVRFASKRPLRFARVVPTNIYPVYASRDDVPQDVWDDPNLVVERYVAERVGADYCCRHWLFLGSREVHKRTIAPHPVVKATATIEPLHAPVPPELRAAREELGFDYGKFDYGLVDGEVHLYDVNRTPGASKDPRRHAATIAELARGVLEFL